MKTYIGMVIGSGRRTGKNAAQKKIKKKLRLLRLGMKIENQIITSHSRVKSSEKIQIECTGIKQ